MHDVFHPTRTKAHISDRALAQLTQHGEIQSRLEGRRKKDGSESAGRDCCMICLWIGDFLVSYDTEGARYFLWMGL
jgi:hypothetical protein